MTDEEVTFFVELAKAGALNVIEVARVAKGMIRETPDEVIDTGIMLLAAKLCFPEVYAVNPSRAVDWLINVMEDLP